MSTQFFRFFVVGILLCLSAETADRDWLRVAGIACGLVSQLIAILVCVIERWTGKEL